ncbi:Protein phosphatase 1, regulatory subunit [Phytophthora cinnamomi]|uniref:Protein phosphatase 1, regulatory subunit n=1 Tax=Phytophthora cinnamomi TaxID=4785 RepID=UPI00355A37A4|nr:Protein phosphatase 1, regulatory subunit [Phytophthora cinnamomi]
METGRSSSMSGVDSSALPPLATPPPRLASAKTHAPPSKQFVRGGSMNAASSGSTPTSEDELLPESDVTQSEVVTEPASSGDALSVSQQEKMQLFAASPDLELLCRENGITAAQFARNSETVTSLDLFLGFWTSMKSVVYFPGLKELSIINQPTICGLEGVNNCANLEKLCITECGLTKIANLGNCSKLKQLNLSSNKIRRLENLDALVNLEKLWVNQNQLERLDGLWRLTKLTQLWACRNRIDRIDTALNGCVNLTELNLADNRLSSFKGLLSLMNLDQLAILVLSDPHFGDNPVCRLCNYQTYLMCQLPRLSFLDTVELSARNKQIAEATMIKKKMYYNMRIKAIKRDVHGRIRHAETIRNQAEHHMETSMAALVRHKKEIERFLVDSRAGKDEIAVKVSQEMLTCLNLEQLHLAYNQITDMTMLGLQFLDSLKVLHLQGNAIVFLAGLECNTELVDIRLDKNRIRQLDPHSTLALRQLKFLNLEDNGLKSLSNFNNMLSLETLELSNNRLTDLEEVEKLASLPSIIDLRMNNNPLTKKHLYRQHVLYKLNSLKALDGKDVYSDEKERIDILFLHERAAAAASGLTSNTPERLAENRNVYQTQLILTPSSILSKAGFNMQPTSTEMQSKTGTQVSSDRVFPSSTIPTTNDMGNNSGRSFAGYVVTYGNQKRYSSYPGSQHETTIPYLSTKLQQQTRRGSGR